MSELRRKALAGAAQLRVPSSTLPSRPSSLRKSTIPEDVESSGFEILEGGRTENEDGGVSVREKSSVPKSSASKVPGSVAPPSTVPKSSSSRAPKSVAPPSDAPSSVTPSMGLTNSKFRDPSMVPSSTPSMALTNSKFRDASKVPGSMVPSSSHEKSRIVSQVPTDDDEAPGIDEPSSAPPPSASKVPLPASVAPSAVPASAFPGMSKAASLAPRSVAPSVSGASASKMRSVMPSEKVPSKVPTSIAPGSLAPSSKAPSVMSSMKEPSKAPGSQAPSSKAPSVMPSMRDQTKVPSSRAPGSQAPSSKVLSAIPSMRDATKVPGSKLPSVMPSMRDRTKAPEDIPIPPSVAISFSEEKWSQIEKSRTSRAPMKSIFTNPGDEEIASKIATVAPTGTQEEQFQEMMQQLGSCMDKYTWVRREDIGGYLCKGGKHFTSFELIAEGKGGWHVLLEAFKFEKGLNPHGPFYGYPVFPSKAWATNKVDRKTGKKGAFFSLDRKASDGPAPENVPE